MSVQKPKKESLRERIRQKIRPKSSVKPRVSQQTDAKKDKARWINENLSHDRKLSSLLIQAEADVICGQGVPWEWQNQESCLNPSLETVMRDQTALTYFIQFLEPLNALCYVHFWLSADNFRTSVRLSESALSRVSEEENSEEEEEGDCCPDVAVTLSKLMLVETGAGFTKSGTENSSDSSQDVPSSTSANNNNGSGDHGRRPAKKIRVAKKVGDCDRKKGIVPRWAESAPMTNFQHELRDAVKICDRYLRATSSWPRPLPREMVESIVEGVRANSDREAFDPDIFLPAQELVFQILREDYYGQFLESDAFCNFKIDVLRNHSLTLKDALYDDAAAFFFMEFLEKEKHLDLVEFLLTAGNITNQLHSGTMLSEDAQKDAIVVYDRYISLQATHALGFSDSIRLEVEMNLCREDCSGPDPNTFVKPASVVNTLLSKHFFPEFLKSHLYYTYTQELVTTFQLDHLNAQRKKLKGTKSEASRVSDETGSVSSSQTAGCGSSKASNNLGASTSNTLLACADTAKAGQSQSTQRKMSSSASAPVDVRKPPGNFDDPLLLSPPIDRNWTMGQVDSLGRFYSFRDLDGHPGNYDPMVARESSGAVSKIINNFLGRNQREEEEMAWQMAEMMIRDVTSVTMGGGRGMSPFDVNPDDESSAALVSGHS